MTMVVDAIYQNGLLKPTRPLNLSDGTRVRVVLTQAEDDPLARVIGSCDGPEDAADQHDRYLYGRLKP